MSYLGLRPLCLGAVGTGVLLLAGPWFLPWPWVAWTCLWTLVESPEEGGGAAGGEGSGKHEEVVVMSKSRGKILLIDAYS